MHYMLQHIAHDEVSWLWSTGDGPVRTNASEHIKRRQLVEELLFWFYDGFLLPLIRVSVLVAPHDLRSTTAHRRVIHRMPSM